MQPVSTFLPYDKGGDDQGDFCGRSICAKFVIHDLVKGILLLRSWLYEPRQAEQKYCDNT